MKITCVEEAKFCRGNQIVCYNEHTTESPLYLTVEHVYNAGLINEPGRNGEQAYLLECAGNKSDSKTHIFFDPEKKKFSINSYSGPEVNLYTPFDGAEEKDGVLHRLRKATIKCWFRDITEDIKNEKSRKVSSRRVQG